MRKELIYSFIENQIQQINTEYESIIKDLKHEISELKHRLNEKEQETEHKIKELIELNKIELLNATSIKWSKDGRYYNLRDFCRVTKHLFFIKETELKQWLFQQEILEKSNDLYIPRKGNDICKIIDNELYIEYSFIRKKIVLLRSLIFIGDSDNIDKTVKSYKENKSIAIEQMANTVYVECKQRSEEFREHKENKFFVEDKKQQKIK